MLTVRLTEPTITHGVKKVGWENTVGTVSVSCLNMISLMAITYPLSNETESNIKWSFQTQRQKTRKKIPDNRLWCAKTFWTTIGQTFQSVRKLSRDSGNFPECPKSFKRFQKHSIVSVNFPECPETFQIVQKLSKVQKFSRVSTNFPKFSETFLSVRKLFN